MAVMANPDAGREPPRRAVLIALAVLVTCAAAGRLALAGTSLWFDEQASVFFSDQPFSRLWSDWMLRETNPPLYYSVLKVWRGVAGSSDVAIRALSVSASLAAIMLLFVAARRAYGARAGLIAAGLAAVSGQQLYFAEQARAYVFVLCAALIAIGALLAFVTCDDRRTRWRAALVYAVAATIAIYLHTTMLLFPAITLAAVIVADPGRYRRSPSLLVPLLVANVAVLLAAGWAIRQAVLQVAHHSDNIAAIGLADRNLLVVYPLQTLFLSGHAGKTSYGIALLVLALAAAFVLLDWTRRETRFLAAIGMIAVVTFGAIGTVVPVFVPRTIFWISAIPLLLAAGGLARIAAPRPRWTAVAILVALLAVNTGQIALQLEAEDWNEPVRRLAQQPDALLLVQGEAMAVLADSVCRRQLRRGVCPYTVVAVTDRDDRLDSWAAGSYSGAKVAVGRLGSAVGGRTIFMFRKNYGHDLPKLLHARGLGAGVPVNGPVFIGPLPASALR